MTNLTNIRRPAWCLAILSLVLPFAWGCESICFWGGTGPTGSGPIRGVGTGTVPISPTTATGVLSHFTLSTTHGDHNVADLGILKSDDSSALHGFFSDRSPGGDEWTYSARYCTLPDDLLAVARFASVTGRCERTACDAGVAGLSSTTAFLLVGFRVTLPTGDQKLGSLVVMPSTSGNTVLVAFNGPRTLDTGFDYTLQYALVPADRLRLIVAEDEERLEGANAASVHHLSFRDSLAGDGSHRYLGGFSFARIGLHHNAQLEQVSVDLGSGVTTFQDDNAGELVRWRIKYYVPRG